MKIIDINKIGGSNLFKWDREYLFRYLTTGKNPAAKSNRLQAALRQIDRADFLPDRLKSYSYEDKDVEIAYGEVLTRPSTICQMIEMLEPVASGNYLDVGSGSGYLAALLAFTIGGTGHVYAMERVQWLWEIATQALTRYKDINNISFLYRDGANGLPNQGPFDGIHVSFIMGGLAEILKQQLKQGGKLVMPSENHEVRVIERVGADDFTEEMVPGFVFMEGKSGVV